VAARARSARPRYATLRVTGRLHPASGDAGRALDAAGREALLRYVLRPPIAQDKVEHRPDGQVRIVLKKPYADGTVAVDMDPLSLLSRLAASVLPPRHHTVRYAGVLGAGSEWRSRIVPGAEGGAPRLERVGGKSAEADI
jgi:hypothetical protein